MMVSARCALLMAVVIGPQIWMSVVHQSSVDHAVIPELFEWGPHALLLFILLILAESLHLLADATKLPIELTLV